MRQGLFLPPFDGLADPNRMIDLALTAEAAGWDGFFLWDHLLYADPVRDILDPYICLAAMASATSTIELGPMVTPLNRRRPAIVARQAATLDLLSRGRLTLGFGIGDDGEVGEFSRFGEVTDARERGRMLDEGLDALKGLLSGDELHHRGEHYTIDGVTFLPTSARDGGIPIWIAARWPNPAPIRRASRFDGVVVIQMSEPSDVATLRQMIETERGAMSNFDLVIQGVYGDDPTPWQRAGASWFLSRLGPYGLEYDDVQRAVAAGPLPVTSNENMEDS
jgi:alkanesulfonate monooxygenase SsuD/methylene tetrahydromethanopterin reductase-like flavin-dependent oxidoreductase (luciferase family)